MNPNDEQHAATDSGVPTNDSNTPPETLRTFENSGQAAPSAVPAPGEQIHPDGQPQRVDVPGAGNQTVQPQTDVQTNPVDQQPYPPQDAGLVDSGSQQAYSSVQPGTAQQIPSGSSQPSQPLQTGGGVPLPVAATGKGSGFLKKKIVVLGIAVALVLAGTAGYVFGYYLPNTPERVWSTGMSRTGDQVTTIVEKFANPTALESFSKNQVTVSGSLNGTSDGDEYSVVVGLDSKYDSKNTDSSFDAEIDSNETGDMKVGAQVRTQLPDGAVIPNIYLKLSGLSSIDFLTLYLPNIGDIDDTWIAIEQDFITEQFSGVIDRLEQSSESDDREGLADVSQSDVVSIVNDVNSTIQEYVFTADPEKAVVVLESFVGTEQSEGITANHYMAKINPDNSKKLCEAMADKLAANSSMKKFFGSDKEFDEAMDDLKKDCDDVNDELNADKPFDLWIDKKYKLLHKIRVYEDFEDKAKNLAEEKSECVSKYSDLYSGYGMTQSDYEELCSYIGDLEEEGEAYVEVGQVYKGDNQFTVFSNYKRDTNKENTQGRLELRVNADTLAVGGTLTVANTNPESGDDVNLDVTIETVPFDGEIDSSKPEGAKSIEEVLQMLLGGSAMYEDPTDYYTDDLISI